MHALPTPAPAADRLLVLDEQALVSDHVAQTRFILAHLLATARGNVALDLGRIRQIDAEGVALLEWLGEQCRSLQSPLFVALVSGVVCEALRSRGVSAVLALRPPQGNA